MSRSVETGTTVFDTFPVFESDGFTRKSGLLSPDFSTIALIEGVVSPVPVTIVEEGATGIYRCSFVPLVDGLHQLEISVPYGKEVWGESYDVSSSRAYVEAQLEIIKGLLHHNSMVDLQTYVDGQLTSARVRMFDTVAHIPASPGGNETLGRLAEFRIVSEYDGQGLNKKFVLKRMYP